MGYSNVDIDIDDFVSGLSRHDKQELIDDLYNDGYCPKDLEGFDKGFAIGLPQTESEHELIRILNKVWENRDFLTAGNIDVLRSLSKKGFHS